MRPLNVYKASAAFAAIHPLSRYRRFVLTIWLRGKNHPLLNKQLQLLAALTDHGFRLDCGFRVSHEAVKEAMVG